MNRQATPVAQWIAVVVAFAAGALGDGLKRSAPPPLTLWTLIPLCRLFTATGSATPQSDNKPAASAMAPQKTSSPMAPPAPSSATAPPEKGPSATLTADQKRAREAFMAGRWEEALQILEATSKAMPHSPWPPKVLLARWCMETGQATQARYLLEQAAREDPKHPEVYLTNGHFAYLEGRLTDTILNCQAALEVLDSPRWEAAYKQQVRWQARLGLASAYEARRDFLSAVAQLRELLQTEPRHAALRQRYARLLFWLDRIDEALEQWQQARRDDPTLEPPELQLAQMYVLQRDPVKARDWFGKAATRYPEDVRVQRLLAVFLLEQGDLTEARKHLEAVQRLEPNSRDTRALVGYWARYARDYPTALKIFEGLVRDYPAFPFATANLALVLTEQNDEQSRQRAVALAENYVRQQPLSLDARAILAYTLHRLGQQTEAERLAQATIGPGLLSPDGAYLLAVVLQRQDAGRARSLLQAVVGNKEPMFYRREAEELLRQLTAHSPSSQSEK
jgi:tetratricopeptide (TPR) repeat protein